MDIQLRNVTSSLVLASRKGGTGVLVHPMDETSKFVSGLSCRNALVVLGGHLLSGIGIESRLLAL